MGECIARDGIEVLSTMTVTRNFASGKFQLIDRRPDIPKKQIFIFGSIIASGATLGAAVLIVYLQYLHNPTFHMFLQTKGIYL